MTILDSSVPLDWNVFTIEPFNEGHFRKVVQNTGDVVEVSNNQFSGSTFLFSLNRFIHLEYCTNLIAVFYDRQHTHTSISDETEVDKLLESEGKRRINIEGNNHY